MRYLLALLLAGCAVTYRPNAYERIGERLVKAARDYIFRVHAMNDADEAAQRLAQRRREYMRSTV